MRVGTRERAAHVCVVHVVIEAHPLEHAAVVGLVLGLDLPALAGSDQIGHQAAAGQGDRAVTGQGSVSSRDDDELINGGGQQSAVGLNHPPEQEGKKVRRGGCW